MPIFTQLASDNFTPDANPLNPANWTVPSGFNAMQALSGRCQDNGGGDSQSLYTGVVFPLDQYMQVSLNALNVGDLIELGVRQDAAGTTSDFIDLSNNGNGTLTLSVFNGDTNPALYVNSTLPFSFGDTFRLAALGSAIYVYHNGALLTQQTEVVPQTGVPAPSISIQGAVTNQVSVFSAGSVSATATLSGSVGAAGAGATITLTGTSSGTTTAAGGTGNFSFSGLVPGTYTVTPGLTGHAFSPTNRTVTITTANISGINFTEFTPAKSGSNSGGIMASGPLFATRIISPNTSITGTNLGTEIRK